MDNAFGGSSFPRADAWVMPESLAVPVPRSFEDIAFSFKGRIGRGAFWLATLLLAVAHVGVVVLAGAIAQAVDQPILALGVMVAWIPMVLWVSLAVHFKRWHDLGYSGWAFLLGLIPIVNLLAFIALGFFPGQPEVNQYGMSPAQTC